MTITPCARNPTMDVVKAFMVANIANALVFSVAPILIAQKVCSPGGRPHIDDFICHDSELVALSTQIATTGNTVRSISSALSIVLFGAWRDASGRSRPLMIIGVLAEVVGALAYVYSSWDWVSSAWIPVIVQAVIGGLFGQNILQLGANCLVIKNTTPRERIVKLQIFLLSEPLATIVANFASGFLLTSVGFQVFFLIVVVVHAVAFCMILFIIKEEPSEQRVSLGKTLSRLRALFKSRPNTLVIWLMLFAGAIVTTYIPAEQSITVFFTQQGFGFTVKASTTYITYHTVICIAGAIVMPMVFVKCFRWRHFQIGIISCSLTIVSGIALAFVRTTLQLYLVSLVDILKYIPYAIPQSILSNCVKSEELGLYLSFGSIVAIGLPFGLNYLYNYTFNHTYQTMPGAIFFISSGCNAVISVLFGIGYWLYVPQQDPNDCENQSNGHADTASSDPAITPIAEGRH